MQGVHQVHNPSPACHLSGQAYFKGCGRGAEGVRKGCDNTPVSRRDVVEQVGRLAFGSFFFLAHFLKPVLRLARVVRLLFPVRV